MRRPKDNLTAFARLVALGPEVMGRVEKDLLNGEPASVLVKWLHKDMKVLADVQPSSLKKALERFRLKELQPRTLARIAATTRTLATKTVIKRLNVMDHLEEMVTFQRARLDKLLTREAQMAGGILLKDTSNELRLLKELLMDLGKVQLETGLLPRAPRTIRGSLQGANGEIRQFEWTEAQEEMYREIVALDGSVAAEA